MKRVTTTLALLLSLTTASIAIAAGGPGKFRAQITGKGTRSEHGMLDGTWTIDLANAHSGHVNLTRNGKRLGGGRYVISGSTIRFTPKPGGKCTTRGTYRFKLHGSRLTFTTISDACATRRDVLTYGSWTPA